jgi:hypothetical protein
MQDQGDHGEHEQQVDKPARYMENCKTTEPSY